MWTLRDLFEFLDPSMKQKRLMNEKFLEQAGPIFSNGNGYDGVGGLREIFRQKQEMINPHLQERAFRPQTVEDYYDDANRGYWRHWLGGLQPKGNL